MPNPLREEFAVARFPMTKSIVFLDSNDDDDFLFSCVVFQRKSKINLFEELIR